jgi:hypothetical protein
LYSGSFSITSLLFTSVLFAARIRREDWSSGSASREMAGIERNCRHNPGPKNYHDDVNNLRACGLELL